jgi:hypothetical protein
MLGACRYGGCALSDLGRVKEGWLSETKVSHLLVGPVADGACFGQERAGANAFANGACSSARSGLAALQPAAVAQWWGECKDGEMHTEAIGRTPAGTQIRNHIRFFSIETNRFAWESNVGVDDGNTWLRAASLTATRSKS